MVLSFLYLVSDAPVCCQGLLWDTHHSLSFVNKGILRDHWHMSTLAEAQHLMRHSSATSSTQARMWREGLCMAQLPGWCVGNYLLFHKEFRFCQFKFSQLWVGWVCSRTWHDLGCACPTFLGLIWGAAPGKFRGWAFIFLTPPFSPITECWGKKKKIERVKWCNG